MTPQAILGTDGSPLRSECTLAPDGTDWLVALESRSGGSDGRPPRNPEYDKGLTALLDRIMFAEGVILDATVEPSRGPIRVLPTAQKRLRGDGLAYPITLSPGSVGTIRLALMRAQKSVALERRNTSSNPWRRIQLRVRFPESFSAAHDVGAWLIGGATGAPSALEIESAANDLDAETAFAPTTDADARRRVLASIARRQGQPAFRKALLAAYDAKCAVSGCSADAALEAAHIAPYRGGNTNDVRNGLLLRADLHTLFDRGLIAICPDDLVLLIAPTLQETEYATFAGRRIFVPDSPRNRPARDVLKAHLATSFCS